MSHGFGMAKQPLSCNRRNSLRLPSTDGMISLWRKAGTMKSEKLTFYSRSYVAVIRVYDGCRQRDRNARARGPVQIVSACQNVCNCRVSWHPKADAATK